MTQSLFGIKYQVCREINGQQTRIGQPVKYRELAIYDANKMFATVATNDSTTDYVVVQDAPGYYPVTIHSARQSLADYEAGIEAEIEAGEARYAANMNIQ